MILSTSELKSAPCSVCFGYFPLDAFAIGAPYTDEMCVCRSCASTCASCNRELGPDDVAEVDRAYGAVCKACHELGLPGCVTFTTLDGVKRQLEITPGQDYALAPLPCCDRYADGRVYPKTRIKAVPRHHDHDTHYCDAVALCCGKVVGACAVRVSTIWGIDADRQLYRDFRGRIYR